MNLENPVTIGKDSRYRQQPIHPLLQTPAAREVLASIVGAPNKAHQVVQSPGVISKLLVKLVSKNRKSSKTFTLRNIDTSVVNTCARFKSLIQAQLKDQIVSGLDFDVGFLQNSNLVVNLQSPEDLREVWSELLKETG